MYQRLAELAETRLYDQTKALAWWAEALVEDPRWERALEESERLAGDTGAWNDMVTAYSRALERTQDKERAARDAAPPRPRLRIRDPRRGARGRDAPQGARDRRRRMPTRSPPSTGSTSTPRCTTTSSRSCAAASRWSQDPDEQLELYFRRGAIFSDALGDLEQSLKCYTSVLDQESRNRRALEAIESIHFRREDWKQLFETYEKLIDTADTDARWPTSTRAWRGSARTRSTKRSKAIELLGRVLDIRGEEPQALAALADLTTRQRASGKSSSRSSSARSRSRPAREQIPLYKHLGRVWEEKLGRERNALDAWLAADRIDGNDLETLRSLARLLSLDAGVGRAVADDPPHHRRRPAPGRDRRGRDDRAVRTARSARGRCARARRRSRRCVAPRDRDRSVRLPRARRARGPVRARRPVGRVDRRAREARARARRRGAAPRDAAPGRRDVGGEGRGPRPAPPQVYERVARDATRRTSTASERLEAIYRQQYKWTELVEILLERSELEHRRRAADPDPQRGREDLRERDRRSGERVLRAAGRVQARLRARRRPRTSSSASPRRPTAGRSCSTSTPTASTSSSARIAVRPPTCGSRSAAGTAST